MLYIRSIDENGKDTFHPIKDDNHELGATDNGMALSASLSVVLVNGLPPLGAASGNTTLLAFAGRCATFLLDRAITLQAMAQYESLDLRGA